LLYKISFKDEKNKEAIKIFLSIPLSKENIEKSIIIWTELSKQNHADAISWLRICYTYGIGMTMVDTSKAEELLTKSCELGNAYSIVFSIFFGKSGYSKNNITAFNLLQKLADEGDVRAFNTLAYYYKIEMKDNAKTYQYCKLAYDKGYVGGIYNIGCCYDEGTGVDKNLNKAIEFYKIAFDMGDIDASYLLGLIYEGKGVNKNLYRAKEYFEHAAKNGNDKAKLKLSKNQYSNMF